MVRYLALGDSFTIGTGGPPERSFPARLAERWRARGLAVELENLGVNGHTTDDLIRDELPAVRPFAPTLVTLMIGTNDLVAGRTSDEYRAKLRLILERLRGDGVAASHLVLVSSPDWSGAPRARDFGAPTRIAFAVDAYASVTREEATRAAVRFHDLVPLSRVQTAAGKFAPDGLHFSAAAYAEWAEALDEAMRGWELP